MRLVICVAAGLSLFALLHCASPCKQLATANLEEAAKRLSAIAGKPVRSFSTIDFGRAKRSGARSVVVPAAASRRLLDDFRAEVAPPLAAFIGTTQWLGEEKHPGEVEIVLASVKSQLDILRVAQSDAVNFDLGTEDLVKKLQQYDQAFGIEIFHAETDTVEFRLKNLPPDLSGFCRDLYNFCPDIVDQGVGSLPALESEIRKNREVYLWWD